MAPELLFLGDSHTAALADGAALLGVETASVWFSGSLWHDGNFAYGKRGFEPVSAPTGESSLAKLRETLGRDDPFAGELPVITTFGFHLGRLTRPFNQNGHQIFTGDAPNGVLTASSALTEAYVTHHRQRHIDLAKHIAAKARTIVVAPPFFTDEPNFGEMRAAIIRVMRQQGLTVFDPMAALFGAGNPIPREYMMEDGQHGTPEFGAIVLAAMGEAGLID